MTVHAPNRAAETAVRLLLFSDIHLDTPFAWAPQDLARKRRQALRDTVARIVELAVETTPTAVLCGGDLYEHDRFSPDTGEFLRAMFERLHPTLVLIAPGNHDWYGPESLYHRVKWSPNVHVFSHDRLSPLSLAEGVTMWGAAHCAPASATGFLDRFHVDRGGVHLALFHGSERSLFLLEGDGKAIHAPFDAGQIEQAGLHHAFLGHYHRPRDADYYTYPGNPDPLTFGEDGERGVVIATCSHNGTIMRERRRVAGSDVHDLNVDLTGCENRQEVLERVTKAVIPLRGVARVTLVGEIGTMVDVRLEDLRREELAPNLDGLVARIQTRPTYDFDTIAQEPTVRGQFVRDVRASLLPEDERLRVLVTGLRALEGRDDLEVP